MWHGPLAEASTNPTDSGENRSIGRAGSVCRAENPGGHLKFPQLWPGQTPPATVTGPRVATGLSTAAQDAPPFHSGTSDLPPRAGRDRVLRAGRDRVLRASRDVHAERRLIVARAAARLHRTDQPQ